MNIVVLDGGTLNPGDISWSCIDKLGKLTIYNQTNKEDIVSRSKDADILIVNKVVINAPIIDKLPHLKYIAVSATGYNNIDIAYCKQKAILVSHVKNYGSANVAQHVFALILALTNRVQQHHTYIKEGIWAKKNAFSFWDAPIVELAHKTIGIIGWGNIGKKVGKIAAGFQMDVIYFSSSNQTSDFAEAVTFNELLNRSDFISINTHLTPDNKKMVNENFLAKMKSSAFLINTSRGGLVDEAALKHALLNKQIAGAGLDVLSKEPPNNNHPLINLNNCIVTPHNAWATIEARRRLMHLLCENIEHYLNNKPINLITE